MSTESSPPVEEKNPEVESLFGPLPDEVSGWKRHSRNPDKTLFEYWKVGSTHIAGKYEQLAAQELRDGEIRLENRVYDQYNHLITTRVLSEQPPKRSTHVWNVAKDQMEKFPASEEFDNPPEMPTTIGDWELVSQKHEQPLGFTVWELPFGEAELIVEETDVIANYSHTKRPHDVRYREPETDTETVVSDSIRTSAFEIATSTLHALSAPLSEMQSEQENLRAIKGVGPAKSRQLILLGITNPTELSAHINADSNPINHHHSEAVDKILTQDIRECLKE